VFRQHVAEIESIAPFAFLSRTRIYRFVRFNVEQFIGTASGIPTRETRSDNQPRGGAAIWQQPRRMCARSIAGALHSRTSATFARAKSPLRAQARAGRPGSCRISSSDCDFRT